MIRVRLARARARGVVSATPPPVRSYAHLRGADMAPWEADSGGNRGAPHGILFLHCLIMSGVLLLK